MGCDIHFFVEAFVNNLWVPVKQKPKNTRLYKEVAPVLEKSYEERTNRDNYLIGEWINLLKKSGQYQWDVDRNYCLFTVLAGVRRIPSLHVISRPRGLPSGLSRAIRILDNAHKSDHHSHSYLILKEIMEFNWHFSFSREGYVMMDGYQELKEKGWTDHYFSPDELELFFDNKYRIISTEEMDNILHNQIQKEFEVYPLTFAKWNISYVDFCDQFCREVLPQLQEACQELVQGDLERLRAVFWFDN